MDTGGAGVRVGKYQLLQRLGAGGMAELWLARHTEPGFEKVLALKRMLPDLSGQTQLVSMFLDEARLGAGLEHPNIVQVFDFGQADGSYSMAMEYLAGEDLGSLLKLARAADLRIPPGRVAQLLIPAARARHHAHHLTDHAGRTHSVVHRDISPSNLMVIYDGVVNVLDFGIAKTAENATRTEAGAVKGKYPYMSPEQVRGLPLEGRRDVFALGAPSWSSSSAGGCSHTTIHCRSCRRSSKIPFPGRAIFCPSSRSRSMTWSRGLSSATATLATQPPARSPRRWRVSPRRRR